MTVSHQPNGGGDAPGQLEDLLSAGIARVRGLVEADVERVRRRQPGLSQGALRQKRTPLNLGSAWKAGGWLMRDEGASHLSGSRPSG